MRPIHYDMLCCPIPLPFPQKEICPLTRDINPQSSQWNSRKMNIAYNSAYVQIETFNFTFAQQAVVVYFYRTMHYRGG